MTTLAAEPAARAPYVASHATAAGAALSLSIAGLAWRISPASFWPATFALGVAALAACLALVATSNEVENRFHLFAFVAATAAVIVAVLSRLSGAALEPDFGLASLTLAGLWTYRVSSRPRRPVPGAYALAVAAALTLLAYNVWYVVAARDLEIADFMNYRLISIAVAHLIDSLRFPQLIFEFVSSMKADYSWAPALAPGSALALGAPLSRAVYQTALMICYATPALVALAWLSRELAIRAGLARDTRRQVAFFGLAMLAVAATYPTGLAVAARGLPDIGGLAFYGLALALADRLARTLTLPKAAAKAPRIALALALTLFAMFLFRRWYAFAAVGIVATLALEVGSLALRRGRDFAWKAAIHAGALAMLAWLALLSPVIIDWLADPQAHDYSTIYAAYRKPAGVFLGLVGDWWGFAILLLVALGAVFLFWRSGEKRLMRLTFGAAVIGAVLFLRVQTPYVHHMFLIAPAAITAITAPMLLMPKLFRATALLALVAVTLTPLGSVAPKGLFPTYGQPHAPRQDLAELGRMKDWVDTHAGPRSKVCGLGSSYTFSGQLLDELWQLKADRSPLRLKPDERVSVTMSDVDTVEGAPTRALKDCAFILVGDPVQTHLIPAYQLTVTLPSREMLGGEGIGAHYRRSGEVFHLEKGVSAVVFERMSPLSDDDMTALAERWRAERAEADRQ